jgi:cytochrome c oxidase cbb3-type subunit 3
MLGALAVTAAILHEISDRRLRARLLMTIPDSIADDSNLNAYAMPRGLKAFTRYCAACHSSGQSDTVRGIPDLRDHDWLYGTGRVEEIEKVIRYGIRSGNSKGWNLASMPAFATPNPYRSYETASLTPQEIDDVTEYLYSYQHPDADAAGAARGKLVYENQSRGLCWDCHGGRAQGDPSIGAPNLTDRIWLYGDGSRRSIRTSIAYGRGGSCPAWIGVLEPVVITALAVYTHSLSTPDPNKVSVALAPDFTKPDIADRP